jgi:hypothetical protein
MMAAHGDMDALIAWLHGELGFRFWRIVEPGKLVPVAAAALAGLPHGEVVMARETPDAG